jgi:hypothetical protein
MREYKSPFKFSELAKDSSTWLIAFGSGFAFMAVMSYIASAIPTMMAYGYDYPFATTIFAVGGICGIVGSFLFGLGQLFALIFDMFPSNSKFLLIPREIIVNVI